ncbi:MAG: glycosyltransferase, partial [Candidatus Latescibacterota bacterium]
LKICTLTHTYPRFVHDINAPFVEQLMEHIAGLGNEVSALTAHDPAWSRGPEDHTVDLRTYRYIWPERLHILGYSRTIEGNVRFRKRVMALSPFMFFFAERAFLKLVREKKPEVLHAHWILPNGFIAGKVSKATGIPLLIQLHGSDVFTAEKNPLFRRMARFAAKQAAYIVSPSPDLRDRLGALGIDTGKIGIVPNTVESDFCAGVSDRDVSELRVRLGVPGENRIVLAMGRMVHVKGFDHLLEAFARVAGEYTDVTLVLAGGGVLFDDMRRRADELGLGARVIMPGPVTREEVPGYFRMADVFVVPSVKHESGAVDGLPVVIPEAMAAGLPIIASEVGGIPVLVRNDCNGILIPQRDPKALAAAMRRLLADTGLCRSYGDRARNIVECSVNYNAVAEHFDRLYREIATGIPPERMSEFVIREG